MTDREAILASVASNLMQPTVRMIAADWFEEFGEPLHAEQLRLCSESLIPVTYFRFASRGYGNGYGYGDGDGDGDGDGYGNGYGDGS